MNAKRTSSGFRAAYGQGMALWPVAVERLDLETEFGSTRVNACGPSGGPPLVLLSGGGTTSAVWYARVASLARTHRVYAVDLMGGPGLSVPDGRPLRRPADLMAWLDGVVDALGAERVALLGHSYGGWIALSYAVHAPDRVERLALLDPTQCFAGFRASYLVRAVPLLVRPGEVTARRFLAWEARGGPAVAPELVRLTGVGGREFRGRPVTGPRPDVARLGTAAPPALVLLAGRSRAHDVRRVAAAAGRSLPGARVVTVPGVGHHALPELRSAELDGWVAGFLTG
ncbi:alpha/beta fold hydrolase [Streptomyces noursei]|uniref:alpha/beta fold hydrolase n=1 Tax=Streptomyces noursei TaxID=1971 RepID=UPI0019BBB240|nr:alpha/beta fold hydrolase [Streptomyces noursei]MCZ1018030.1 alpha/beta fold hydrolase [Streptomyces noursei]GGW86116.1 carboxylesterase [Streptomyces noursei]